MCIITQEKHLRVTFVKFLAQFLSLGYFWTCLKHGLLHSNIKVRVGREQRLLADGENVDRRF